MNLHLRLKSDGGHRKFARPLGEEHILTPDSGAVVAAVDTFILEAHLGLGVNFLYVEAVELRHLSCQLLDIHQRVQLVGKQHSLLFINLGLGGGSRNVQLFRGLHRLLLLGLTNASLLSLRVPACLG